MLCVNAFNAVLILAFYLVLLHRSRIGLHSFRPGSILGDTFNIG